MTIEEAIEKEKSIAKSNHELANSYHTDFNVYMRQEDACRERAEYHEQVAEWLEELQRLKEQQPCDDCISRQAVLDCLTATGLKKFDFILDTRDKIKNLPPITPKPKMGRWIDEGFYAEGHNEHAYRCSECDEQYIGYVGEFKHCPNCGAKMESRDKE